MKHALLIIGFALTAALPAQAGCYADFKAKRDNPLRLHYGVAEIAGPCSRDNARDVLAPRLAAKGWTLLNVLSVFDEGGLAERASRAGPDILND
jgi:hypothetical protein